MRISDWSSDVCSSDLRCVARVGGADELRPLCAAGRGPGAVVRHAAARTRAVRRDRVLDRGDLGAWRAGLYGRGDLALDGVGRRFSNPSLPLRSEEHTSELQSLMRISYAVFCLKKTKSHHKKPKY